MLGITKNKENETMRYNSKPLVACAIWTLAGLRLRDLGIRANDRRGSGL
ncbi:MAG: hypothetical protein WCB63_16325 [Polyangiales bacterium]